MAIQTINRAPSFGQNLTNALGGSLEALTRNKINEIHHGHRIRGLEALGLPREAAYLPDQFQDTLLKNHLKQQRESEISRMLNGEEGYQSQSQTQPTPRTPGVRQEHKPQMTQEQFNQLQAARPDLIMPGPNSSQQPQGIAPQQMQPQPKRPVGNVAPLARPIPGGLPSNVYNQYRTRLEREQAQANATNKKYIDELDKDVKIAEETGNLVDEMKQLLATGKVATSGKGRFLPGFLQNYETQAFTAKANELAGLLASKRGGRLTAFGLKLAQQSKPNIEQKLLAQSKLLEDVDKSLNKVRKNKDIFDQIIAENGGYQPANINSLISLRSKELSPGTPISPEMRKESPAFSSQPEESQETPLGTIGRGIVRTGSRIGEALATNVGDLASAGFGIGNYLTGGKTPTYEQIQEKLPISPPTSAQAQEFSEKSTGGYTKPQGEIEEFIDNVVGTATKLLSGGWAPALKNGLTAALGGKAAGLISKLVLPFSGVSWQKALTLGAVSETAGKGAEILGAGPVGQTATKAIALGLGSIIGVKDKISSTMTNSFAEAEHAAAGKSVPLAPTKGELRKLFMDVRKGAHPNKDIVSNIVGEVLESVERNSETPHGKFTGDKIGINELTKIKKDINQYYKLADRPMVRGEKHLPSAAKKYIGDLNRIISKPIEEYGKSHPSFGKPYALANDLHKGLSEVDFINKWLNDHKSSTSIWKSLLPSTLSMGAGVLGISALSDAINRALKNPSSQRHYLQALAAASAGNTADFSKHTKELEKSIKK